MSSALLSPAQEGILDLLMALFYKLPGRAPCMLTCELEAMTEYIKNQIEAEHTSIGSYVLQCYMKNENGESKRYVLKAEQSLAACGITKGPVTFLVVFNATVSLEKRKQAPPRLEFSSFEASSKSGWWPHKLLDKSALGQPGSTEGPFSEISLVIVSIADWS